MPTKYKYPPTSVGCRLLLLLHERGTFPGCLRITLTDNNSNTNTNARAPLRSNRQDNVDCICLPILQLHSLASPSPKSPKVTGSHGPFRTKLINPPPRGRDTPRHPTRVAMTSYIRLPHPRSASPLTRSVLVYVRTISYPILYMAKSGTYLDMTTYLPHRHGIDMF